MMATPTRPTKTPKALIVEMRRAQARLEALEQDLARAFERSAPVEEISRLESETVQAREQAAARRQEHDRGLAEWDVFRRHDEEERAVAERARAEEIRKQVWREV
jgi:hypothetical protein